MTFLDSFEQICRSRGEAPSHALEACGLSKSLYQKWKKNPDRFPYGSTIRKLADYFGCSFEDLDGTGPTKRTKTEMYMILENRIARLSERDQKLLLKYIDFTFGDELQKL